MRPIPFVPSVEEIRAGEAGEIAGLEQIVSYWTGGACGAREWFGEVTESWGTAGFVVRRGEETLGFVVYGPQAFLPCAERYPVGPLGEDAALLTYVEGDARTRRRLLVHRRAPLALRLRLLHALDLGKVLLHALQLREDGVALRVCALEFK